MNIIILIVIYHKIMVKQSLEIQQNHSILKLKIHMKMYQLR